MVETPKLDLEVERTLRYVLRCLDDDGGKKAVRADTARMKLAALLVGEQWDGSPYEGKRLVRVALASSSGLSVSLTAEARSHLKFLIQGGDRCDGVAGPCRHCAEIFAALASSGEPRVND